MVSVVSLWPLENTLSSGVKDHGLNNGNTGPNKSRYGSDLDSKKKGHSIPSSHKSGHKLNI